MRIASHASSLHTIRETGMKSLVFITMWTARINDTCTFELRTLKQVGILS